MKRKYIISVVMPIYNTEKYIKEAVESIILQTLGFEENIQLIFVNDGSSDGSGMLCKQYAEEYPDNILYINLSVNSGVSVARNMGMKAATGKYITFMDSDDMWSLNAFQRAIAFLEENGDKIDLVSADIEFFEASVEQHPLNLKLVIDKIVNMNEQCSWIRSISSTCIMKREAAEKYHFNENQKCWEDTVFINQVMMNKLYFGMLATDVIYYYRKRYDDTSASQSYGKNKEYFLHELLELYHGIYQESMRLHGYFIPMAQYLLAYALGYRFQENMDVLTEEEKEAYSRILQEVIAGIEDKYIKEIPNADELTKKIMLAFKCGVDFRDIKKQMADIRRGNNSLRQNYNKTNMNYKLLRKWFALKGKGIYLKEYFEAYGYRSIAIYGMADLGQFLLHELQESDIKVVYAVDRRAEKLTSDVTILTMEDELPAVEVIVVTAVYFYNQILEGLKEKIDCPILSMEDVLNYFD